MGGVDVHGQGARLLEDSFFLPSFHRGRRPCACARLYVHYAPAVRRRGGARVAARRGARARRHDRVVRFKVAAPPRGARFARRGGGAARLCDVPAPDLAARARPSRHAHRLRRPRAEAQPRAGAAAWLVASAVGDSHFARSPSYRPAPPADSVVAIHASLPRPISAHVSHPLSLAAPLAAPLAALAASHAFPSAFSTAPPPSLPLPPLPPRFSRRRGRTRCSQPSLDPTVRGRVRASARCCCACARRSARPCTKWRRTR